MRSNDQASSLWSIISLVIAFLVLGGMMALIFYICIKMRVLNPVAAVPRIAVTATPNNGNIEIPVLKVDDISSVNSVSVHEDKDTSSFDESSYNPSPIPLSNVIQVRESPTVSVNQQYLREINEKPIKDIQNDIKIVSRPIMAELKSYTSPPQSVKHVLIAMFILLGEKDVTQWKHVQVLLNKAKQVPLTERLINFNTNNVEQSLIQKAKQYVQYLNFQSIITSNKTVGNLLNWVIKVCEIHNEY